MAYVLLNLTRKHKNVVRYSHDVDATFVIVTTTSTGVVSIRRVDSVVKIAASVIDEKSCRVSDEP